MVATPEVNRQNAQRSTGPRSDRGKAIASLNATKHGLLSTTPPLTAGEDLATFQGMVQALVDEHQPSGPTETMLVQQVAMGWLRLHRLWGAEAATARMEQLKQEKADKTPKLKFDLELQSDAGNNVEAVLRAELSALKVLADNLTDRIKPYLPKRITAKWAEGEEARELLATAHQLIKDAIARIPSESLPPKGQGAHITTRLQAWQVLAMRQGKAPGHTLEDLLRVAEPALQERREEITATLAELARIDQEMKHATIAIQAIPQDTHKLARYERHITRTINMALEQLRIEQERRGAGSTGSFGAKYTGCD